MKKNVVNHNFTVKQLKSIIRELNIQLGRLEAQGTHSEVREKMLDISHYDAMLFKMIPFKEYAQFDEEVGDLRAEERAR